MKPQHSSRFSCCSRPLSVWPSLGVFLLITAVSSVIAQDISSALDGIGLSWQTGGDSPWYGQANLSHDGDDAASSGQISGNQNSWIQTTVVGAGKIGFWWKVSSEQGFDALSFYVSSNVQAMISGEVDWQLRTFLVSAGTNTLKWQYSKDTSFDAGQDKAWLDQVSFIVDPPTITAQPQDLSVIITSNATFSVAATNGAPIYYQWRHNMTNILSTTSSVLVLTNIQIEDGGIYSVTITNSGGSVLSSNATLTVLPQPSCAPQVAGFVSWWRGSDGIDSLWTNNGVLLNGATDSQGVVGQCFAFNGQTAHLRIPDSPSLRFSNAISIEAWIYPSNTSGSFHEIVSKWSVTTLPQKSYTFSIHPSGRVFIFVSPNGTDTRATSAFSTNSVPTKQWSHVVGTYDGHYLRVYINGNQTAQVPYSGGIYPGTNDLGIGGVVGGGAIGEVGSAFNGRIDEVCLYARALSADEIKTAYLSSSVGKCGGIPPPYIVNGPVGQILFSGGDVQLSVAVVSAPPVYYQWYLNGKSLENATNSILSISNAQPADSGSYQVAVFNSNTNLMSEAASLIVNSRSCIPVPDGLVSWWDGNSYADDVANVNNGQMLNGANLAGGKVGNAFEFSNGAHVRVPDSPSLRMTTNLTIEAWIYATSVGDAFHEIVSKWSVTQLPQKSYTFSIHPSGQIFIYASPHGDDAGATAAFSTAVLAPNRWTHVAASYDGIKLRVYVDGIQSGEAMFVAGIFPGTNDLGIGGVVGDGNTGDVGSPFYGYIDEASIYSRALTATEIRGLYEATEYGKCASPQLKVNGNPTDTIVSWPKWATRFTLQEADIDGLQQGPWTDYSQYPISDGTDLNVHVPIDSPAKFYRLRRN